MSNHEDNVKELRRICDGLIERFAADKELPYVISFYENDDGVNVINGKHRHTAALLLTALEFINGKSPTKETSSTAH